jgi:RNA polymerase sigma-70 factor (ECF subfamily)
LEVSRSLGRYRGEGSLSGWIKKICISKALMRLRRTIRFADESVESAAEMILGQPDSLSSRLDIEQAMMRLGDTARVVVWLHDVEGFTHEEIAALMGMSVSFSKSQLSRAHARLRALLGEERGTPCGT